MTADATTMMMPHAASSLRRIRTAAGRDAADRTPEDLRRVCREMESLFINQLLKQMRQALPKGGLFGESHAQDMFTAMYDNELARKMAGAGGLGLANILMAQLSAQRGDDTGDQAPLKVSASGADNPEERKDLAAAHGLNTHGRRGESEWK